ncbi:MAG: ornithine--oxo-acid transaminase [Acidobacteriota bacterium]|jgi:ornithine--oxo-acid transaminase|nr:ornithine--oxo-acid transaminase [Acidobacteriota bacterium]
MAEYTSSQLMHMEHEFGAHNYHPLEVVIARAEGVWVWDPEGNKYMDCLAAYSAVNQGHRHPRIIQALKDQADRLTLTSRAFFNDRWPLFARKLARTVGKEMVLPMNTGAEAVETAIKLARRWGYEKKGVPAEKAEIIVMCENFHGRTTTIVSFSTDDVARSNYGPYTPGFKLVPYNDVEAVRAAVNANTVAVLVEPIQGEAGVMVPDDGYLRGLREVCDNSNTLLICDEVQTGFCRTGKLFAFEYEGIVPDIIIMGKALGGGVYPVSAIAADKAIMEVFTPGSHGSTFGGNPLACAVAEASIDVLLDEDLAGNAMRLGEYFRENLRSMNSPKVDIVRGKGLLNAVVMNREAGKARQYTSALKDAGVLAKETHDWIIRFAPPLTVTRDELDWALERIRTVLA